MIRRSQHHYCSHKCADEHRKILLRAEKEKHNYKCPICGKEMRLNQYQLTHGTHCCSNDCAKKLRSIRMAGAGNHQYGLRGEKNASWKGGRTKSSYGYILVSLPEHPFANGDGNVFEHRLIAEKYLLTEENSVMINGKRYLSPKYDVHHKDENKQNNAIENLLVMTKSEHIRYHNKKNRVKRNPANGRFIKQ